MKSSAHLFVILSIGLVFVYFLFLSLESSLGISFNYITSFWIPGFLIGNAVFVAPFVVFKIKESKHRSLLIKKMVLMALISFILGIIFLHVLFPPRGILAGWEVVANLFLSIAFIVAFIVASVLAYFSVLVYSLISQRPVEVLPLTIFIIFNFIVPMFSVILFILSFLLIISSF